MPTFNPEHLKSLTQNVKEIIGGLTLPEYFKNCPRYNGAGTGKATVAKTLKQEFNITWTSASATQLPANENQVFLFRNMLRALIYLYRACPIYAYQWLDPTGSLTWPLKRAGHNSLTSQMWANNISGAAPHGSKLFPGRAKGKAGILVNNDGVATTEFRIEFQVAGVATAPGAGTVVTSFYWTGKDWAQNTMTVMAAPDVAVSHTAPAGGAYMYFDVDAPAALPAGMNCIIQTFTTAVSDVWAQRAVSNVDQILSIAQGARVNGAVGWLRNESPEMYEQGRILGSDVVKTLPWTNIASGSSGIQALDEYYSGDAKVGAYAFITPDDEEDFQMQDDLANYTTKGSSLTTASFPLKERSPYVSMAISGANDVNNSRSFSFITWHMIEYYSNSPITQKEDSPFSAEDWQYAIEFMKHMEQIYENKFHVDQIFDAIARYGGPISMGAAEILAKFPQTAFIADAIRGKGFQDAIRSLGSTEAERAARKKLKR